MKVKDYVFVMSEGAKPTPVLVRVTSAGGTSFSGRIEKDPHLTDKTVSLDQDAVIANLGPKPPFGRVYGYDLADLYRGSKQTPLGDLHIFGAFDKEKLSAFLTATDRVAKRLESRGLLTLAQDVVHETHPQVGKYSGTYHPTRNPKKRPPRIHYYLDAKAEHFDYVLLHELGHALHFQVLKQYPEVEAKWLRIYNSSVKPRFLTEDRLNTLLRSFQKAHVESFADWYSTLDEETRHDVNVVLRWLSKHRSITKNELTLLLSTGHAEDIAGLWPDSAIETARDLKPIVSKYATKKFPELLAETFAFKLLKKKLPAKIDEAMDHCLSLGKQHLQSSDE